MDAIISLGYRVNSKQGIQFRQWVKQRLRDYLVKGYSINQKRLEQLHQTVQLISEQGKIENLKLAEAKGLLEIIQNYSQSLFCYISLTATNSSLRSFTTYEIQYKEAKSAIETLKKQLIRKK